MNSLTFKCSALFRCIAIALVLSLGGCTDYWWHRGQPPSVDTLLMRSAANLKQAQADYGQVRADVSNSFSVVSGSLDNVVALVRRNSPSSTLAPEFDSLAGAFMTLEGKLSLGSRPAYGELAGQLRAFGEDNLQKKHLTFAAFGLFAARTKNFLASELSVPAPVS